MDLCAICDIGLDGVNETSCQRCGCSFHYYWTAGEEYKACGGLASHDDALAIVFLCNDCISDAKN
jgi:hypothetical protein